MVSEPQSETSTQPPTQTSTLNLTDLSNPNNPYRLETSDNPSILLVTEHLTTENYSTWSKSIQRALRAKNKLGFLDGTIDKPPSTSGILLSLWERCNDMLVSWLQNAISPPLRPSVAFVDNAQALWLELHDCFSPQNGPRIYELKKTLANFSQETDTVSTYYGKLKSLWDELSLYDPLPVCSCASTKIISDRYQRDCVIQFLMGLYDSFTNVRDQIMLLEPLPPVNKVFSYIQQQERHHLITYAAPPVDTIALAARRPFPFSPKRDKPYCTHCKIPGHSLAQCFKSGNTTAPVCTHCAMTGHTAERCYKLHGYPPGHKYHKPRLNAVSMEAPSSATNNDPNMVLTKEQYQELIALLHNKNSTASLSANQLQTVHPTQHPISSAAGISLCLSSFSSKPWIIDTGATDHMICSPSFFTTVTSSMSNFVKLPNGEVATVTHIGPFSLDNDWKG
ncbi:hypothetical protein F0562_032346 [Nyssa sinensis]|uniref:Retrotransposon Copia-like N-terminal domain-containing protein n=1 Tax=Nyssa sinensis TaxID=561372 RepID=A0A5J5AMT6_9ASTE|nr:hypothetical protein F0562_032346 [Nyssa sinensis]